MNSGPQGHFLGIPGTAGNLGAFYAENHPPARGDAQPPTQASRTPAHGLREKGLLLEETEPGQVCKQGHKSSRSAPGPLPQSPPARSPRAVHEFPVSVSRALLLRGKGYEHQQVMEGSFWGEIQRPHGRGTWRKKKKGS